MKQLQKGFSNSTQEAGSDRIKKKSAKRYISVLQLISKSNESN